MDVNQLSDPEHWVDAYGDTLFRYALLRLRDPELAEDVIQETLLAALQARESFSGRSSERTWLIGILKHKIIDHIRKVGREQPLANVDTSGDSAEDLFDEQGKWKIAPVEWSDPDTLLEKKEFWEAFERCLSSLPDRLAHAFSLREMDGLSSEEICNILEVSTTNLWVMLHRARMRLRRCLEINWFGPKKGRNL